LNETERVPPDMRRSLIEDLTSETIEPLQARARLDLRLWSALAARRMPSADLCALRERTVAQSVARYAALLAP
jgi:hypothetical protein